MRIAQTFRVDRPPERVFDYVVEPANLAAWQTSKTRVEPLDAGPPREGYRLREWTKPPGGKEFEQVVEFSRFDRPPHLRVQPPGHRHPSRNPQPPGWTNSLF